MLQSLFRPVLRPIMMGVMSVTGSRRAWSPADLTALAAWYDPSDLSTMFQDAAGTTPVTEAGQPVGLILDKSGNGHHASQATSTARPLFQIDGSGKHYLAFDGVDDYLSTAAIDLTGTDKVTVFVGTKKISDAANYSMIASFSENSGAYLGTFALMAPYLSVFKNYSWTSKGTSEATIHLSEFAGPDLCVITAIGDISAPFASLSRNGTTPVTSAATQGTGNYGSWPLYIGGRGELFFNGNIYSLIIGGALYDAATVIEAEAWVAEKTGVTL